MELPRQTPAHAGKKRTAYVVNTANRVPECIAVLAQLDEIVDDEPQLGEAALRNDGRRCKLLSSCTSARKLLAELARR